MIIFLAAHLDVFAQPLLQWDKRFSGPVGSDRGNSIAVDSSGNVYVTGRSIGTNTNYDYLTIKFNLNGDTLWTRRFNGLANKSDEPVIIKVDNQGNVYVKGKTERVNGSFDIATIKYDSLGSQKWLAIYNGTITTGDDLAYNIEVDEFSNVYVVGSSFDHYGSSNYKRGIVIQYNYLGIQQWKANFGDYINKVLIYDLDKLLVISNSGIVYDIYELDANNGSEILNYPGGTLFESFGTGNDMIIDDAGNIYVVSTKEDVFDAKVYTTKFTRGNTDNPIFTWWKYDLDNVSAYTGISVKLDKNKNVYTLASVTSSINYCTISKRNASMQNVWIKPYFLDNSIDFYPVSFSLRRKSVNPDIYVSGYTSLGDIITGKFDNNDESVPNLIWEVPYDCGTNGNDVASMMVQDQYDNIFITGYSNCNGTSDDVKTIKYCVNVPVKPENIVGNTFVCEGDTSIYSVALDSTVVDYSWILPSGWTGSSTTDSIVVVHGPSGMITVVANGHSCSSDPQSLNVVTHTIPPIPGNIAGDNTICSGTDQAYTITPVNGATSYSWNFPSEWNGSSSNNTISVLTGTTSGNISVNANNACGSSPEQVLFISVTETPLRPDTIIGDQAVCNGEPKEYSVPLVPGVSSYWNIPAAWGVPINPTNNIICFPTASGTIEVFAKKGECMSPNSSLLVTVNSEPNSPDTIFGNISICSTNPETYIIQEVQGSSHYTWAVPSGWSGQSTSNSITLSGGESGYISVLAGNECGESLPEILYVTVNGAKPSQPSLIQGDASVCPNSTETYIVHPQNDATEFVWNQAIWGTSNSEQFQANFGNVGGDLTVFAKNGCGFSPPSTIEIVVIDIDTTVSNSGSTLSSNENEAFSYQWIDCTTMQPIQGETTQSYTPSMTGHYKVLLTQDDCISESFCHYINVTGLNEMPPFDYVSISPNPTNKEFNIASQSNNYGTIEVYNTSGQKVYFSSQQQVNDLIVDMSSQPAGVYTVIILIDKYIVRKQLVKI